MSAQPQIIRFFRKDGENQFLASVSWKVRRDAIADCWVGVCESLELTAQGRTFDDFRAASEEIQVAYLRILFSEGTLSEVLEELGWNPEPSLPSGVPADSVHFDIPTTTVLADECHASGS